MGDKSNVAVFSANETICVHMRWKSLMHKYDTAGGRNLRTGNDTNVWHDIAAVLKTGHMYSTLRHFLWV